MTFVLPRIPCYKNTHLAIRHSKIENRVLESGFSLGVPLNIITNLFTQLHYGHDITTIKLFCLQFLIGYYTYGKDRYKDALEYETHNATIIKQEKKDLYESILKYRSIYRLSYCISFYMIGLLLYSEHDWTHTLPIMGLLYTTEYYTILKENASFLKPFYVSFMWTFSTTIMPCVLHDHNYDILKDVGSYIPCMLLLFSATNIADIQDIEEDK